MNQFAINLHGFSSSEEKKRVRIVCVSDTHDTHQLLKIPDGDILIHAGDAFLYVDRFWPPRMNKKAQEFNQWLESMPHKHKIVIAGNHDAPFWKACLAAHSKSKSHSDIPIDEQIRRDVIPAATAYLQDSSVRIEGINLYGSPWNDAFIPLPFSSFFQSCKRAFSSSFPALLRKRPLIVEQSGPGLRMPFGASPEARSVAWNNIPSDTDILITHVPPFNILDRTSHGKHRGCPHLRDLVLNSKGDIESQSSEPKLPRLVASIFGHVHGQRERGISLSNILFVNAASTIGKNDPVRDPVIIDVFVPIDSKS